MKLIQFNIDDIKFSEISLHCMRCAIKAYGARHIILGKEKCDNIFLGLMNKYHLPKQLSKKEKLLYLKFSYLATDEEIACMDFDIEVYNLPDVKNSLPYISENMEWIFNNCNSMFFVKAILALKNKNFDGWLNKTSHNRVSPEFYKLL